MPFLINPGRVQQTRNERYAHKNYHAKDHIYTNQTGDNNNNHNTAVDNVSAEAQTQFFTQRIWRIRKMRWANLTNIKIDQILISERIRFLFCRPGREWNKASKG